jgi:hypothetical protein
MMYLTYKLGDVKSSPSRKRAFMGPSLVFQVVITLMITGQTMIARLKKTLFFRSYVKSACWAGSLCEIDPF